MGASMGGADLEERKLKQPILVGSCPQVQACCFRFSSSGTLFFPCDYIKNRNQARGQVKFKDWLCKLCD